VWLKWKGAAYPFHDFECRTSVEWTMSFKILYRDPTPEGKQSGDVQRGPINDEEFKPNLSVIKRQ
jgi:hypothetical protein